MEEQKESKEFDELDAEQREFLEELWATYTDVSRASSSIDDKEAL